MRNPHLGNGELPLSLWEWSIYIIYLEMFLPGRFVFFVSFIYSVIHVSVWTHEHLFYILTIIQDYLFYCSSCASFGHWEFFWLAPVPHWHTPIMGGGCLCVLAFLFSGSTIYSSLILYISCPVLDSAIFFPSNSGSFYWRMMLETKVWVLVILITPRGVVAFRPFQLTENHILNR